MYRRTGLLVNLIIFLPVVIFVSLSFSAGEREREELEKFVFDNYNLSLEYLFPPLYYIGNF